MERERKADLPASLVEVLTLDRRENRKPKFPELVEVWEEPSQLVLVE